MSDNKSMNLYKVKKNSIYQVTEVPDEGLLENLGIRVGSEIEVKMRYRLSGPVLLCVEGSYTVALGKDVAKMIKVKNISSHEAQLADEAVTA